MITVRTHVFRYTFEVSTSDESNKLKQVIREQLPEAIWLGSTVQNTPRSQPTPPEPTATAPFHTLTKAGK
jgi:hypothetical protein